MNLPTIACIVVAVVLQTLLGTIWTRFTHHPHPFISYVDIPLIVVTYFAFRRDIVQSMIMGAVTGIMMDALGGGLLGAGSFSYTLTVYLIATLALRFHLNTPLLQIPVLAGAAAVEASVYVFLQKLFGEPPAMPFAETMTYKVIATTIAGAIIFYLLDLFFSEQRRQFALRRRVARRRSFGR
jgi:rod shape-determining protein MreD